MIRILGSLCDAVVFPAAELSLTGQHEKEIKNGALRKTISKAGARGIP
jgi:hypothetical protein